VNAVISDSTCLIGLERIDALDILPKLFSPVVIPQAVHQEFGIALPWLHVECPANQAMTASLRLLVHAGEAEAIALAYEKQWRVILDDQHARKVAARLGITKIGTVGILLRAKQHGLVPLVRPLLEQLAANSFRISDELCKEALIIAGE
jgi:predicted nucleic acid-binding protein